jgi:hypothetical protein
MKRFGRGTALQDVLSATKIAVLVIGAMVGDDDRDHAGAPCCLLNTPDTVVLDDSVL